MITMLIDWCLFYVDSTALDRPSIALLQQSTSRPQSTLTQSTNWVLAVFILKFLNGRHDEFDSNFVNGVVL